MNPDRPTPVVPDHTLLKKIGRGAYGEVWMARNIMGAWRAVKIVYRNSFGTSRPFDREFEGIQKFEPVSRTHDSQIDVLHIGRNEVEGYFYYVMELADDCVCGRDIVSETYRPHTLRSDLEEHRRLPAGECINVAIALCTALEHLHAHGLIHRDIKPSNVIFVHGRPKLADPGLVAGTDDAMSFVGTEGFIPPEGPGTICADLYGLGKVLYELHTGMDRSEFPALPTALATGDPPELSRELNLVILKACAPKAQDRYSSATQMSQELVLLQSGQSVQRLRHAERALAVARRVAMGAAAVALLMAVAYISAIKANRKTETARKATMLAKNEADAQHLKNEVSREAFIAQARVHRTSGQVGQRLKAVEAIGLAAKIRPSYELRNEAIATFILPDLEEIGPAVEFPVTVDYGVNAEEQLLAFGSPGLIHVIRMNTREEVFAVPSGPMGWFTFSPDGQWLSSRNVARQSYWKIAPPEKRELGQQQLNMGMFPGVIFSPDSALLAFTAPDEVQVIETSSGEIQTLLPVAAIGAAFSPTSDRLAVLTKRGFAIWNLSRAVAVAKFQLAKEPVLVTWLNDNMLALTFGEDQIEIWDIRNGRHSEIPGSASVRIGRMFPRSNGRWLAVTANRAGGSYVWDLAMDRVVITMAQQDVLGFSRNGGRLAFVENRRRASFWRFESPDEYQTTLGKTNMFATLDLSEDRRWLAGATAEGVQIWDLESGFEQEFLPGRCVTSLCFATNSATLNASTVSGSMYWTFDRKANTNVKQFLPVSVESNSQAMLPKASDGAPQAMPGNTARTTAGELVAEGNHTAIIKLRRSNGDALAEFSSPDAVPIQQVHFDHTGRSIIAVAGNGRLHIWHLDRVRRSLRRIGLDW